MYCCGCYVNIILKSWVKQMQLKCMCTILKFFEKYCVWFNCIQNKFSLMYFEGRHGNEPRSNWWKSRRRWNCGQPVARYPHSSARRGTLHLHRHQCSWHGGSRCWRVCYEYVLVVSCVDIKSEMKFILVNTLKWISPQLVVSNIQCIS